MSNTTETVKVINTDCDGEYKWTIDGSLLTKINNAKNGQEFTSNRFKIGQITWQIELCPNGENQYQLGSCLIFLTLVSMPSKWKDVTITRTIQSIQTYSKQINVVRYATADSNGWTAGVLSLQEIQKYSKLEFLIKIKILQIKLKKNSLIYYSLNFRINKTQKIKWKMNKHQLEILQQSTIGKRSFSNIYDNLWSIYILPNGDGDDPNECWIGLRLCALPPHIHKLKVKRITNILPTNIAETATADF